MIQAGSTALDCWGTGLDLPGRLRPRSRAPGTDRQPRPGACPAAFAAVRGGRAPVQQLASAPSPGRATGESRGDSLFAGGPGNTEKEPARFTTLLDDLERKVFDRLPDATHVYPAHAKDTTLGAERPSVPEWRARGW